MRLLDGKQMSVTKTFHYCVLPVFIDGLQVDVIFLPYCTTKMECSLGEK